MGVAAKKSLGQHFLVAPRVIDAILTAVDPEPAPLVEIGPGRGALLEPLLQTGRPLTVVELDHALATEWRAAGHTQLTVLEADAAGDAWLAELTAPRYGVVANLPYNAGTAILRTLIRHHERFDWLVLMFQREVADRILHAGERAGGPMGILAHLVYDVRPVIDVEPGAFRPPPRVSSRVLKLVHRPDALPSTRIDAAWRLLLKLFQRRRARLDRAVAAAANVDRNTVQTWFGELDVRPDARPDHMSVAAFAGLLDRIVPA